MVGLAYWERGRPDQAITIMEESIRLSEAAGFVIPQVWTRSELAMIYYSLGDVETAFELVSTARDQVGKFGIFSNIYIGGIMALMQLSAGDLGAAEASLEGIGKRLTGKPESLIYIPGYQAIAESALRQGQADQALSIVGRLLDFLRESSARPFQMQALLQQARISQTLNRPEEAHASLKEARSIGEFLGSHWTMWQIEAELGRLAEDSADAQAHFRRARTIIDSIHQHTPDHLRDSFLSTAAVQAVMINAK
jgi:tetratricopeptide (TPR) repeat protein